MYFNCTWLPSSGPRFQLKMLIRVCSSKRFGTLVSKRSFGWEKDSFSRGPCGMQGLHYLCTPYGVPALWLTSGLTPVYIHGTRNGQQQVVKEGQLGWVLQAVISRATFWRIPRNSKSHFTMMSLHIINNQYAKKRGIAENLLLAVRTAMHQEQVDMVAGD